MMTVQELYRFAIEKGTELDPRGADELARQMGEARDEYEGLDETAKRIFDTERFENPFGDTRIVCGDPEAEVKRIICGIDIGGAEVVMADNLRHHGTPVDMVVAHHPSVQGGGLGSRRDTIWPQVRMMTDFGVPEHKAAKLVRKGAEGIERSHDFKITQVAQAVGMPFMTIHSPADIFLLREGERILAEEEPRTVGDLIDIFNSWPEVGWLIDRGKGAETIVGDKRDPLGKTYFSFYGGWNPTPEAFEAICEAGCGTLCALGVGDDLQEIARKNHISIVIVPHYPADNLGLNMLFDAVMAHFGEFDIIECGNFVRVAR